MNGPQFDRFVAAIGRTASRRQWLRHCLAGVAAGLLSSHRDALAAQENTSPPIRQADSDEQAAPLPNFPFLVVMPTDSRYSSYAIDEALTGPPTRFRSLDAMPAIDRAVRAVLEADFQSAYAATIASAPDANPDEPDRGVTTVVFDFGSRSAAEAARDAYLDWLVNGPAVASVETGDGEGGEIALLGCEGGCADFRRPVPALDGAVNELAVIGVLGQFLFDARTLRFSAGSGAGITGAPSISTSEGNAVARLVTGRLAGVTAVTSVAARRAAPGSLPRRLARALPPRVQDEPAGLRDALAARNTLPIFDLGDGEPPLSATQTLIVDGGDIVVRFGESAASAAARQRSAGDAFWVCGTDQALPMRQRYRDGYDLSLSSIQSVFLSVADGEEYLKESRERLERDRPLIDLSEIAAGDDEIRDVYRDGRERDGFRYGCLSHKLLRLGELAAILAVEVKATPRTGEEAEIGLDDVEAELCPILAEAAERFELCILSPDDCRSAFLLSMPDALQFTPDSTACPEPQRTCGGQCTDVTIDPGNCGKCGTVCPAHLACVQGSCQCTAELTDCGEYCAYLPDDPAHCGECFNACAPDEYCAGGECRCAGDGGPRCGDACCPAGWSCDDGLCTRQCEGTLCGDVCVDLSTDATNCGRCGAVCYAGACCAGVCVDTETDRRHCGGCDVSCGGLECCAGLCADTRSDPGHCGGCGNRCNAGETCDAGTCSPDVQSP
jgi:hypothetical protein